MSASLTTMSNNSMEERRKVGKSSPSPVKEPRVLQPKTELTHKTRKNKEHQHTKADVHGAILETKKKENIPLNLSLKMEETGAKKRHQNTLAT